MEWYVLQYRPNRKEEKGSLPSQSSLLIQPYFPISVDRSPRRKQTNRSTTPTIYSTTTTLVSRWMLPTSCPMDAMFRTLLVSCWLTVNSSPPRHSARIFKSAPPATSDRVRRFTLHMVGPTGVRTLSHPYQGALLIDAEDIMISPTHRLERTLPEHATALSSLLGQGRVQTISLSALCTLRT